MTTFKAVLLILLVVVLIIGGWILIGALFAFLWNAILVDALALDIPTINLWVGVGLAVMISFIGKLLH